MATVTVAKVRIRLPYTDLVASRKLGWYSRSEAEFQSVPLERRWVDSGSELSAVAVTLAETCSFLLGTGTLTYR